jgi:signal transduction histidine kinase
MTALLTKREPLSRRRIASVPPRRRSTRGIPVARDRAGSASAHATGSAPAPVGSPHDARLLQVLAAITHDLLQPLAAMTSCAALLRDSATDTSPDATLWLAERIDGAATRMTALVGELLDSTQVQPDRPLDLRRQTTDLVGLVRQQAELYQQTTALHTIQVQATVPTLIGTWDRTRLERVVANLVTNAIKYSPAGGVIGVRVAAAGGPEPGWVQLVVQDAGLGIPAADLPHIFAWGYRGHNVVGQVKGIGIGLAGVNQIVEQHGGTIHVCSQEGAGTTVTVRLPRA